MCTSLSLSLSFSLPPSSPLSSPLSLSLSSVRGASLLSSLRSVPRQQRLHVAKGVHDSFPAAYSGGCGSQDIPVSGSGHFPVLYRQETSWGAAIGDGLFCPHPSLTCFPELGHLWSTGLSLSHAVVTQAQRKEGIWIYPTMKFVTGSQRIGRLSLKSRESFSSPQYISQRLEEHAVTGQLPGPQYALPPRAPDGNGHLGLSTGRAGEVSDSSQGA